MLDSHIFHRPIAVRLGEGLLAGFALWIFAAGSDAVNRHQLETFKEVTAVGDRAYLPVRPGQEQNSTASLLFQGKRLLPAGSQKAEVRDSKMIRAGKDDSGSYHLYTTASDESVTADEAEQKNTYYLKLAPNEYLRVRLAPSGG